MEDKYRVILIVLLATNVFSIPEERLKRGYNNGNGGLTGYGIGSDEKDASIDDSAPCGVLDDSGSREHGYGPDGHLSYDNRRGISTSVKAAAAASASSYN